MTIEKDSKVKMSTVVVMTVVGFYQEVDNESLPDIVVVTSCIKDG